MLAKRWGLGTFKFLLFALNAAMFGSMTSAYIHGFTGPPPAIVLGIIAFMAALLIYWWTVDVMILVMGAYRVKGCELLR